MQIRTNPTKISTVRFTIIASLLFLSTSATRAQAPQGAKPPPEQALLNVWVGEWTYQGAQHLTPQGAAGTFAGRQTARLILNGFFLETKWKDTGSYDGKQLTSEGLDLEWFNTATKTFMGRTFDNDGDASTATITASGNTWTSTGTRMATDGKLYRLRFVNTFSVDGKTCTTKGELSADDGKTWMPYLELTMKKVGK
jgi:hypothetical protein